MPAVILPSENQQREFDAKLLVACELAERGVTTYIGARHEIHAELHRLPRSVYVAKDLAPQSGRIFSVLRQLGHRIVAWDEEGLVAYVPEVYYKRRISPRTIPYVRAFFAWGEVNRELIAGAPGYPGTPIHVSGNPRIDLLRPELRGFYEPAVAALRARYGTFVLFNSNFGMVNSLVKIPVNDPATAARQHPDVLRFFAQRRELFAIFQRAIPELAARFHATTIVVRPHPSESPEAWRAIARIRPNVQVVHEGPVIPWLLAARVMLHNSCTTGLESFLLGRPAISLMTPETPTAGSGISNALSVQAHDARAVGDLVQSRLDTDEPFTQTAEQWRILRRFVAATDGPLAAERIADEVARLARATADEPLPDLPTQARGHLESRWRKLRKRVTALIPDHKTGPKHNLHRYPGLAPAEVVERIERLQRALSRFAGVQCSAVMGQIYRIAPGTGPGASRN